MTIYISHADNIEFVQPRVVRLLLCATCKIHTNHKQSKSGVWFCWCGTAHQEADNTKESE